MGLKEKHTKEPKRSILKSCMFEVCLVLGSNWTSDFREQYGQPKVYWNIREVKSSAQRAASK